MSDDSMTTLMPLSSSELESVLAAWQDATVQLEQTHRALRDEVKRLTDELEIKNRELARKNRLADLGQMASHIAHEVRNNLVPVALYLSMLRRRVDCDSATLDLFTKIDTAVGSLDVMVNDLLHFTSDREPRLTRFSLVGVFDDVIASLEPQLQAQRIEIERNVPATIDLRADRDMLRRAILNLVLNAVDAMTDGGKITLKARCDGDLVELAVADTGPGLNADIERRAFEPFFTTKNTGTGLGLAIVGRIVDAHGGSCVLANRLPRGAVATLRLPSRLTSEIAA